MRIECTTQTLRASAIIAEFALRNGVTPFEFVGHERDRDVAWPRQDAMRAVREETDLSLPVIGRLFGGRDHKTILLGIRASAARAEGRK